jgi:hypothetical protein
LRYADQHRGLGRAGIDFNDSTQRNPTYRDFAHAAFTIGMCYSADSPHGALPRLLSYVFGAATVGGSVKSHCRPDSLDLCGAQGCAYSTEAGF